MTQKKRADPGRPAQKTKKRRRPFHCPKLPKCQMLVRLAGHVGLILFIEVIALAGWPASWAWAHRAADRLLLMAEGVE